MNGFGTCSVLFGFQLVLLYELTMEKGFLSVKGRGIGKGDKEKTTTSADDLAKDENGANKATNCLYQNVSPPVIANRDTEGLGSSTGTNRQYRIVAHVLG
nr:hypothetical protein [Tanacetum cinerariifolium]